MKRKNFALLLRFQLLCILGTVGSGAPGSAVWPSDDFGVVQCRLEGKISGQPALLHIFVNACWRVLHDSLELSGVVFMRPTAEAVNTTCLEQPVATLDWWRQANQTAVHLRSTRTYQQYPLNLAFHQPKKWQANPSLRREPGRLQGTLQLHPDDVQHLRFEITAHEFTSTCLYDPGKPGKAGGSGGRRLRMAAAGSRSQVPGTSADGDGLPGIPMCAWASRPVASTGSRKQVGINSQKQAKDRKLVVASGQRAGSLHAASAGTDSEAGGSSGSGDAVLPVRDAPAYMVVSPFFGLPAADFASLLLHHMRYHWVLGITHYLVYVEEQAEALAHDVRLTGLLESGRLTLVLWKELPHFIFSDTGMRHPYASQILVYNHALLALWPMGVWAAVADLDEYLITSRDVRSVQQLMEWCAAKHKPKKELAVLWIPRRNAFCEGGCTGPAEPGAALPAPDAVPKVATRAKPRGVKAMDSGSLNSIAGMALAAQPSQERQLWLGLGGGGDHRRLARATAARYDRKDTAPASGNASVLPAHPMTHYTMWAQGWHHKSVVRSSAVAFMGVHLAFPKGSDRPAMPRAGCAFWLHVRTQLSSRRAAQQDVPTVHGTSTGAAPHTGAHGARGAVPEAAADEEDKEAIPWRYRWLLPLIAQSPA